MNSTFNVSQDHSGEPIGENSIHVIRHIDHVTYATRLANEEKFINRWKMFGFREMVRLQTKVFPATHIALVSGMTEDFPWGTMTGLSVSEDPASPINDFIYRYGEGVQHIAYNVHPDADMETLQKQLRTLGWQFMTPVLAYSDDHGARLRQIFSAPTSPYGTFVELVQRLPGIHGEIFNGFDVQNIDDLYQSYSEYSAWLDKHAFSKKKPLTLNLNPQVEILSKLDVGQPELKNEDRH